MAYIGERAGILLEKFREIYGAEPQVIVRSPGRVNLIGEHTDYNGGFVLPMAIDRDLMVAASPRPDPVIHIYSLDFNESVAFSLDDIRSDADRPWSNYIRGVADRLLFANHKIGGVSFVIQGNVPLGSGLSSSAALEVASAFTFQQLYGFEMTGPQMASLCQAAENEFIGVKCGIMDQFVSRLAEQDHALLIDCRSLDYKAVPLPSHGVKIVVTNTLKKHALVDSEYNRRRAECEEAVGLLKKHLPAIDALRDVTPDDMERFGGELPEIVRRRAQHVVTEDDRVLQSIEALNAGDLKQFGRLMSSSHESLRDLYEVSCTELDILVEAALGITGVLGSRMTGGGFGGCTVSLVADFAVDEFMKTVPRIYKEKTGIDPVIYVCSPGAGAQVVFKA
jgi:galactokinase